MRRGKLKAKKFVSVLIASRSRWDKLQKTIQSIIGTCKNKDRLEIIVRLDDDDLDTLSHLSELKKKRHVKVLVGPRGGGYKDLHLFYNEMAAKAKGKWLFLMADDAEIVGLHWDEILMKIEAPLCLVKFEDGWMPGPHHSCFPIFPKKVFDVLGHISLNTHWDTWLDDVLRERCKFPFKYYDKVKIRHSRPDLMEDVAPDVLYEEEREVLKGTSKNFYSLECEKLREADAQKLLAFQEKSRVYKPQKKDYNKQVNRISRRWFLYSTKG